MSVDDGGKATDEALMRRYQLDDPRAFDELYRRHERRVYGYIRRKLGDPEFSQEVFQTVWLKLHEARDRYRPESPFGPWLFTITYHAIVDAARGHRRRGVTEELDESQVAAQEPTGTDAAADWESIPDEMRGLLSLRYAEGLSTEEIASRLGIAPAAARKRLSRALAGLRRMLAAKA